MCVWPHLQYCSTEAHPFRNRQEAPSLTRANPPPQCFFTSHTHPNPPHKRTCTAATTNSTARRRQRRMSGTGEFNPFAPRVSLACGRGALLLPVIPLPLPNSYAQPPYQQGGAGGGPGTARKSPSPPRANEPSWLKGASSPTPAAAAPSTSHVPIQPATLQPQAAAAAPAQPQQPSGQTPQLVVYMRVANFGLCILMSTAAILTVIVPAGATPASWVLAFYVL